MSWVEKIKEGITITTGDGVKHTPLYVITTKEIVYNVSQFEFVNVEGTLVKRNKAKGISHDLEIVFQGDDHLQLALNFENSNKDSRPWDISHPIYGSLIVQPLSLRFDPTGLNTTKVTGQIIETITEDFPKTSISPRDKIAQDVNTYKELSAAAFTEQLNVESDDIDLVKTQTKEVYDLGDKAIKTEEQSSKYFELFNEANAAILSGFSDAGKMMTSVINVFTYPSIFADGIKNRYRIFENQLETLNNTVPFLSTLKSKLIYEINAGAIISAKVNAAINETDGDYSNSDSVLFIVGRLTASFNTYITNLNSLQSSHGAVVGGYIPSYTSVTALSALVNYTVSRLITIALSSKSKRTFILDKDTCPLILAHRFYGLDEDDVNYRLFLEQNNVSLNDLLIMKKGREVSYYI